MIYVEAKQMKANGIYATMQRSMKFDPDIRIVLNNVLDMMKRRKDKGLPFQGDRFTLWYYLENKKYEIVWNTEYDPSDNSTRHTFDLHTGNGDFKFICELIEKGY